MILPNTIDTFVPRDAHEALLERGMEWQECQCDRGSLADGTVACPDCDGEGGRYVADRITSAHDVRRAARRETGSEGTP